MQFAGIGPYRRGKHDPVLGEVRVVQAAARTRSDERAPTRAGGARHELPKFCMRNAGSTPPNCRVWRTAVRTRLRSPEPRRQPTRVSAEPRSASPLVGATRRHQQHPVASRSTSFAHAGQRLLSTGRGPSLGRRVAARTDSLPRIRMHRHPHRSAGAVASSVLGSTTSSCRSADQRVSDGTWPTA